MGSEASRDAALAGKITTPVLLLGIGLILLGALCIYAPLESGMAVGVLAGIFLVISGLLRTSLFWVAPSWGSAFLRLALGILTIIAGELAVGTLVGIKLIMDGIALIAVAGSCSSPDSISSLSCWSSLHSWSADW